ncbi:MAG: signal peptidase I [Coriobacteriales bacterium]|nr:signal peptidase I [Coriobacteriales bacterium]
MKLVKDILFWVSTVILVAAILAVAATKMAGVELRAVTTGSMTPEIPVGSLVIVVPTEADEIKLGDDITFVIPGDVVVTHRVVKIDREKNEFTTWGIANARSATDAPNKYENILGVVKLHLPLLGMLLVWLSTWTGKILAATAIIALYLLFAIIGVLTRREPDAEVRANGGAETNVDINTDAR